MRTSLLPGLLNLVSYNLNRGTTDVRLFEAGDVFQKRRRPASATNAAISASSPPAMRCAETVHARRAAVHLLPYEGRHRRVARGIRSTSRSISTPIRPLICIPAVRRARSWTARPSRCSGSCIPSRPPNEK